MLKQKVFISSTIYDFRDLRSALQFYLEEKSFEVILSEVNLFTNNKMNSYEACLDAISGCNYFILLVGGRTGGKYRYEKPEGKTEQITITCAEYRRAYELFEKGEITILNFVRQEIYSVKKDREGLAAVLKKHLKDAKMIESINNHDSEILKDAREIIRFLEEISKKTEMKKANTDENKQYPQGNWVYQFDSFGDIIKVLKNVMIGDTK